MILAFDTETTGLPDWHQPSDAAHQPHIVQLAAILADDDGTERASANLIVCPNCWDIPTEAAAIHGITQDRAVACGVSEELAVETWMSLILGPLQPGRSRMRSQEGWPIVVAHNDSFDWRIMRIAMLRCGYTRERIEEMEHTTNRACTMRMATPILNLPPTDRMRAAGFTKPKSPSVSECMAHFFAGELHTGAHDAMADARACLRLYLHMVNQG